MICTHSYVAAIQTEYGIASVLNTDSGVPVGSGVEKTHAHLEMPLVIECR